MSLEIGGGEWREKSGGWRVAREKWVVVSGQWIEREKELWEGTFA